MGGFWIALCLKTKENQKDISFNSKTILEDYGRAALHGRLNLSLGGHVRPPYRLFRRVVMGFNGIVGIKHPHLRYLQT